ncbi:MAG TPA: hybrid sensor histidine kinase/response regulator [Caldithrix abyssi]|uniref:histidine kinase n=1 Tax=Caldithrix abyssi TaxID=187145 RepID=A0A7V4UC91_CALAY|nr:hybrid sensor histidine kinase/response regulator [Caldithrix abyssi]
MYLLNGISIGKSIMEIKHIVRSILLFSLIGLLPGSVLEARQSKEGLKFGQIKFDHITVEDGLSNSTVYSITQDKNGFMWFGTTNGLNKYDGYEFTVFLHSDEDSSSLSNNSTGNIYIDDEGIIWVGTWGGGLNRFDPATNKAVHYLNDHNDPTSISGNRVQSIYKDRNGMLWVGTYANGLNTLDPKTGKFTVFKHDPDDPGSLSNNRIWAICEDRYGTIWVATSFGLNRFDRKKQVFVRYYMEKGNPHSLSSNIIRALFPSQGDTLWIGTQNGLNLLNLRTGSFDRVYWSGTSTVRFNIYSVNSIFEDINRNLWVGLGGGLLYKSTKTGELQHFQKNSDETYSLSENEIRSVYVDRSGIVWIGTRTSGINKLNPHRKRFGIFIPSGKSGNGSQSKVILSVYQKNDFLWMATLDGLLRLNRKTNSVRQYFTLTKQNKKNTYQVLRHIYPSPHDSSIIWLSANKTVIRFNVYTDQYTTYYLKQSLPNSARITRPLSLYEESNEILWISDFTGGLIKYNLKNHSIVKQFVHQPTDSTSISHNEVWFIYPVDKSHFWIGTGNGLNYFDKQKEVFKRFYFDEERKLNRRFFTIHVTSDSIFWLGTDYGLIRFNPLTGHWQNFTSKNGLPDDKIAYINQDNDGNLWLSTEHGLAKFNPHNGKVIPFDLTDGLVNHEYIVGCGYRNEKGELFFGGTNGLDYFNPEQISINDFEPPVVLTELKILNKRVNIGENSPLKQIISNTRHLKLSYKDYVFSFAFSALDYSNPKKIKYAYKLEGIDDDWIYTNANNRTATYTTLPGGNYIFRVKATNSDGIWSNQQVALPIQIVPPIWKMQWFRIGVIFIGIIIITALFRYRLRKIRERSDALMVINRQLNEQIAERKRAEEEKEKLQQQLIQSQKMEALGTLAGGVAHDFNNLLTIINGNTELILLNTTKKDKFHRHLRAIHQSGIRAAELTRQLLAFSRKQMVKPRVIDINQTIKEMNTLLRRLITEDIVISTELKDGIPKIKADPGQIQQIILNIVINARDAILEPHEPKEKRITIKTDVQFLDETFVTEHPGSRTGGFVVISILDTGKGIDQSYIERIFEPFFTTKEKHKGTGLGLATVYGIVKQNEGMIYVDSEKDKGTRFDIYWPTSAEQMMDDTTDESAIYAVGRGEQILLVEDDENIRHFVKNILENYGYKVEKAENGAAAVQLIQDKKIVPDLLITDVVMPGLNGRQLAEKLKDTINLNRVLFISGYAFEYLNKENVMDEKINFLQKPFSIPSLLQKVREVIDDMKGVKNTE